MNIEQILTQRYTEFYKIEPTKVEAITKAGSNRSYYRFYDKNGETVLGVYSNNIPETKTFLYYSVIFSNLNLNTPQIYHVSEDTLTYFIEDFGDDLLLKVVESEYKQYGKFTDRLDDLYHKSINALVKLQIAAGKAIDFSLAYSISEFNSQSILFDLNYFKYYFLNRLDIPYDEKLLQDDFDALASHLAENGTKAFMFRDFQARNILVKDEQVYFIDYQGGRKGAIQYDMASLLWQAKAKIPNDKKLELLKFYINEVAKNSEIDKTVFEREFWFYLYVRILQTLGAYGNRGLIEKKRHFIESIPFAIDNLKELHETHPILGEYKELDRVISEVVKCKQKFEYVKYNELTINVMSFGYKNGLPEDKTENGGGFIFDCRGNHNPGRYEEYKKITGLDQPVIDFFKQHGDIDVFIENIKAVISPTIENYISRGFTSLMICFGCTGGQHRSVYSAENIAKYIHEKYGVKVILKHRELGIERTMEGKKA